MTNKQSVRVDYSARFKKDLKRLNKKYRNIRADVQTFIEQLERGETPGDQVQGVKYTVYKARIKSTDMAKGARGSYRVIYYIRTTDHIFLVTMYAKSEQSDISQDEIRRIVETLEPPKE